MQPLLQLLCLCWSMKDPIARQNSWLPNQMVMIICDDHLATQPDNRDIRHLQLGLQFKTHPVNKKTWHSVRSCSQTIPEALAKFWRAAGSKVKAFAYMVRKLRSIAFQRCIWRGGLPLVEMAENEDFLQKYAWKTGFLRNTNLDQLTSERAGTPNF